MATSEALPLAKTGGLADVCGALPTALRQLGHECTLIMPAYRGMTVASSPHPSVTPIQDLGVPLEIPIGSQVLDGRLLECYLASGVRVLLVDYPAYFDRPQLYGEQGEDYRDNCERFVFFSRAVLQAIERLGLDVDLIHCNDWQTALIPVLVHAEHRGTAHDRRLATLLTIHNLAYQGRFWHWDMLLTGLDWKYFHWKRLEFYGYLNLLKGGIVYADALTTVSPQYAAEIQTPAHGCGLEGVLQQRANHLVGILNGVDYQHWNPATDPHLARTYGPEDWLAGKAACKRDLQSRLGLANDPHAPVVGIIGRLVEQKGIQLSLEVIRRWAATENVQWAILGTGDPDVEQQLRQLAIAHPRRVAVRTEFSDPLAHQIEAGADLFLMPSRFEPCGLNQLYSLKYGTVPLVHAVGGLADTVTNATEESLASGTANGFSFYDYHSSALEATLRRALELYRGQPALWQQVVTRGMRQDWSWHRSAEQYAELYEQTAARVRQSVCV